MAVSQPISTDKLNSPDHSLAHRVFANDTGSSVKAVVVDASNNVLIGDGTTNYVNFASDGYITLVGTAKGKLAMRPAFIAGRPSAGVPSTISIGAFAGYSLPIWTSPSNQYE